MYGRLLCPILLQGYTARPNRVGICLGVRQRTSLVTFLVWFMLHDQIWSDLVRMSHRPITELSSRNCVLFFLRMFWEFFFFYIFWILLNYKFFCDVSSGVVLCPYMGNGCVSMALYGKAAGFGVHTMSPSLLHMEHLLNKKYEKLM